jgi:hypothetical protein
MNSRLLVPRRLANDIMQKAEGVSLTLLRLGGTTRTRAAACMSEESA